MNTKHFLNVQMAENNENHNRFCLKQTEIMNKFLIFYSSYASVTVLYLIIYNY